jgi:hypothetical protein
VACRTAATRSIESPNKAIDEASECLVGLGWECCCWLTVNPMNSTSRIKQANQKAVSLCSWQEHPLAPATCDRACLFGNWQWGTNTVTASFLGQKTTVGLFFCRPDLFTHSTFAPYHCFIVSTHSHSPCTDIGQSPMELPTRNKFWSIHTHGPTSRSPR